MPNRIGRTKAAPGANGGNTPDIDTSGASALFIYVSWYTGSTADVTVSDNKGNTYLPITKQANVTSSEAAQLFYCLGGTVGSGHHATVSGSGTYPVINFVAYDEIDEFVSENGAVSNGASTIQPGSVTPDEDGSLIVTGVNGDVRPEAATINLSFDADAQGWGSANNINGGIAELVQGTAAAINPTWTLGAAGGFATTIAVFKGEPPVPPVQKSFNDTLTISISDEDFTADAYTPIEKTFSDTLNVGVSESYALLQLSGIEDIPGITARWAADNITGLSDGDRFETWPESINGWDAVNSDTATQCRFDTNEQNGLPGVKFGVFVFAWQATYMPVPGLSFEGGHYFAVMKLDEDPSTNSFYGPPMGSIRPNISGFPPPVAWPGADGVIHDDWGSNEKKDFDPALSLATTRIVEIASENGKWFMKVNGVTIYETDVNTTFEFAADTVLLGNDQRSFSGTNLRGMLFDVVLFADTPTILPENRAQYIRDQLAEKWGLNLQWTSQANGDWEDTATWQQGSVPPTESVVSIGHDVVINSAVEIGLSALDNTTAAVSISGGGGKLTIADGNSLVCRGAIEVGASSELQVGEITGGATLTFDSSLAASPINYELAGMGTLVSRGTAASYSLIESDTAGDNALIKIKAHDLAYTTLQDIGTDEEPAIEINGEFENLLVVMDHVELIRCGAVAWIGSTIAHSNGWDYQYVSFEDSLSSQNFSSISNSAAPTETRSFLECTFDKDGYFTVRSAEIVGCFFYGRLDNSDFGLNSGNVAQFEGNILRLYHEDSDHAALGDYTNNIVIFDKCILNPTGSTYDSVADAVNPHWIGWGGTDATPIIENGSIYEDFGSDGEGDVHRVNNGGYLIYSNCIGISQGSEAGSVRDPGTMQTWMSTGKSESYHNTWMTNQIGAHGFGELDAGYVGQCVAVKSNIFFSKTSIGSYKMGAWHGAAGVVTDIGDGNNFDYNCGFNIIVAAAEGGPGYNLNLTNPAGGNDIDEDPDFVDWDVNFAHWVESIEGLPSYELEATQEDKNTARRVRNALGLHKLRIRNRTHHPDYDAAYTFAAYRAYIRNGFTPQNPDLLAAGHDGFTIGAVQVDTVSEKTLSDTLTVGVSESYSVLVVFRVKDFADTLTVSVSESFTIDTTGTTITKSFSDTLTVSLNEVIGAAAIGAVLFDTFDGTAGLKISERLSDSDHQWRIISTFNQLLLSGTGSVYSTHSGGASIFALSNRAPSSVNQFMEIVHKDYTHLDQGYASLLRASSPTNSYTDITAYDAFRIEGSIVIGKWVNGSYSVLNSTLSAPSFEEGDITTFEVVGTSSTKLTVKVNGTIVLSHTDSSSPITDIGQPGIRYYSDQAGSPTTGHHIGSVTSGQIVSIAVSDTLTVGVSDAYSVAVVGGTVSKTFSDTLTVGITDSFTVVHYAYKTFSDTITFSITDTFNVELATDLDLISVRAILGVGDITIQDVGRTSIQDVW